MRWPAAFLIVTLATTAAGRSAAVDRRKAFCASLKALHKEALRSGKPQDVGVVKVEEWTFACRRTPQVAAQIDFCTAAGDRVGLEFTHAFPWYVNDCLERDGISPTLELADQYTGMTNRKKIRRLVATWRDGARIEIRFEPRGDFGPSPDMKDYWGEYRLTITPR